MHEHVDVKKELNAPVEKVWQALTDKAQMNKWYFDIPDFELETHKEFNFYEPGDAQKYHHLCEILEIIAERKLKHTWTYPELSKDKSIVKWELEEDSGKTLVKITHKGLENFKHLGTDFQKESFNNGWTEILGKNLKEFVEQ